MTTYTEKDVTDVEVRYTSKHDGRVHVLHCECDDPVAGLRAWSIDIGGGLHVALNMPVKFMHTQKPTLCVYTQRPEPQPPREPQPGEIWMHEKGNSYKILYLAKMQVSNDPRIDNIDVVVYCPAYCVETRFVYTRPLHEFMDRHRWARERES